MSSLDWGTVPAWLGAGSLILAFRVFIRDQNDRSRREVEQVGAWFTTEYKPDLRFTLPEHARDKPIVEVKITTHVRNANKLPIHIAHIAAEIRSKWMVPAEECTPELPVHSIVEGVQSTRFFYDDFQIAPESTVDMESTQNVSHHAPESGVQLSVVKAIRCHIQWILIIDNAGRRWEIAPGKAGSAKRIHFYNMRKEFWPPGWGRRYSIPGKIRRRILPPRV